MVFSYALIVLNSIYGLVITPYILGTLGEAEFGVYKTISSLSSSLMVLDLGIGGTATRYIAKFRADKLEKKEAPFISMLLGEAVIIVFLIVLVSIGLFLSIPSLYSEGLEGNQIDLARKLFSILALSLCFHVVENVLNGIISGHNHYAFGNGLKLIRIVFRIALTYLILAFIRSSMVLVTIDLLLTIVLLLTELCYIRFKLRIPVRLSFHNWDLGIFHESFKYTGLLFLTSIATQVNSNLDNVVIGAELGPTSVAIYSMALIIFSLFVNISTAINGVMLPTVTNSLSIDSSGEKAKEIVIASGRIQFMLLGAVFAGFLVLGKDFIFLWLGNGYEDVYYIGLLLMGPSLLELCVNVCVTILRAKNILGFRTIILSSVTILNAIVTIVGVMLFGYYAAAVGTGLSYLIGSVIIMNIYYWKKLGYNMVNVYFQVFHRSWVCIVVSCAISFAFRHFYNGTWTSFLFGVLVFTISYAITLFFYGFNRFEKKQVFSMIKHKKID